MGRKKISKEYGLLVAIGVCFLIILQAQHIQSIRETMKKLIVLLVLITLGGCAGGRSYDYSVVPMSPDLDNSIPNLSLSVHDQRNYVKNGEKYPQYVGTQRSPAYVPWNINTKTGAPMADDFLMSIKTALLQKGINVLPVTTSEKENKISVVARLKETGRDRLLLFTINEWYFDIWGSLRIEYDLQLEVFNGDAKLLSMATVEKKDWEPEKKIYPDVEFQHAVQALLNDDKIKQSLKPGFSPIMRKATEASPAATKKEPQEKKITPAIVTIEKNSKPAVKPAAVKPVPKPVVKSKCTTKQILSMKEMGMSDSQI